MSSEQQLTDQFLEAWRNAKDEATRKTILQEVMNTVPETLIPHLTDWLDDAPPLEMFKVIESYKENWSNSFFINITRNDTLRPKLIPLSIIYSPKKRQQNYLKIGHRQFRIKTSSDSAIFCEKSTWITNRRKTRICCLYCSIGYSKPSYQKP